jgi:hypothetical protein
MGVMFAIIGLVLCTISAVLGYMSGNMLLVIVMVIFCVADIIAIMIYTNQ